MPETFKPELSSGSAKDSHIKVIFEVSNASAVTLKNDSSVIIASKKYVDEQIVIKMQPLEKKIVTMEQTIQGVDERVTTHLAENATTTTKGHLQVGSGLTVSNGVISHPSGAGNNHIPSGGTTGQALIYGGSSGVAIWGSSGAKIVNGTYTGASSSSGGPSPRTIAVGFRPKVIYITTPYVLGSSSRGDVQLSIDNGSETWALLGNDRRYVRINENGFELGFESNRPDIFNYIGVVYSYVAIG